MELPPLEGQPRAFATTHWSMVVAAVDLRHGDPQRAFQSLVEAYWYPLYAFARRAGQSEDDAADAVQAFFTKTLEASNLRGVERDKGRFRSYLLGAFKHFLSDRWALASAQKRGGGIEPFSLDGGEAESMYVAEPSDPEDPEVLYERRWAMTLLNRALGRLRREYAGAGKPALFEALEGRLTDTSRGGAYAEAAKQLDMTEGALRVAAHRLRRRFADQLRAEVADTVRGDEQIDDEIRYLISIVS